MPEKKQSFTVQAKLELTLSVDVKAKDMDEALAEAKKLVIGDFVTVKSDLYDESIELTGIFR